MEQDGLEPPPSGRGKYSPHAGCGWGVLIVGLSMPRVYVADSQPDERSALRLVLLDLNMEVVGEAADWATTFTQAPATNLDMLLVDWGLLPVDLGIQSLAELRLACPNAIVVILISQRDARQQVAISAAADAFISKGETPERVAERLRAAASGVNL
jgi:DNA-binding NarL/FixJ family response regulator